MSTPKNTNELPQLDVTEFGGLPQLDVSEFQNPPPKKRTWGEAIKDTLSGVAGGVNGLVKTAGELGGLATGNMDNAVTRFGDSGQQ